MAENLRGQFEQKISAAIQLNDGLTPLLYAYGEDGYQFLTASAERIFPAELLDGLLDFIRTWASQTIGVSCTSTPQLRVFTHGSYRGLFSDNVKAGWHWMMGLSGRGKATSRLRLSIESIAADAASLSVRVDRITSHQLEFNQLLVHRTSCPYAIEQAKCSANPLEAPVFLDGYLW
jgi:hypothetical protein